MPVTVPCPSCGTKLRIPDNAVGKRVKCSKCATAFTAEAPEEALEVPAVEEAVQAPAPAPAPPPAPAPAPAPARKPAPMVEPDDDLREERLEEERLDEEDEEEEERPRRR